MSEEKGQVKEVCFETFSEDSSWDGWANIAEGGFKGKKRKSENLSRLC